MAKGLTDHRVFAIEADVVDDGIFCTIVCGEVHQKTCD